MAIYGMVDVLTMPIVIDFDKIFYNKVVGEPAFICLAHHSAREPSLYSPLVTWILGLGLTKKMICKTNGCVYVYIFICDL